jgi:F-type H+-transporting ATPase subunit b
MNEILSSYLASFLWSLSIFVVFVLLLLKLGVKHVLAAVDAREAKIARELKESEDAYAKAKTLKEELDARMRGAEAKIAEMIKEAARDGEAIKAKAVETAREEIDAVRNRSLREIEAARHAAIVQLKQAVAEVAVQVAEKIVREKLDAAKQESVVGIALDAYEARLAKAH